MRTQYDLELNALHGRLIEMGNLCEQAIEMTNEALQGQNDGVLDKAAAKEKAIDKMERDIENRCTGLILLQQPVATDLRNIAAALKMITDMERIGDQAFDIADILKSRDLSESLHRTHLEEMAKDTMEMVRNSVEAYVRSDLKMAQAVVDMDDQVDALFIRVREELSREVPRVAATDEALLDLLLIAKYYERIGDHAVNIAQWVVYAITGFHQED